MEEFIYNHKSHSDLFNKYFCLIEHAEKIDLYYTGVSDFLKYNFRKILLKKNNENELKCLNSNDLKYLKQIKKTKFDDFSQNLNDKKLLFTNYSTFLKIFFDGINRYEREQFPCYNTGIMFRTMNEMIGLLAEWGQIPDHWVKITVDIFINLKKGILPKTGGPKEKLSKTDQENSELFEIAKEENLDLYEINNKNLKEKKDNLKEDEKILKDFVGDEDNSGGNNSNLSQGNKNSERNKTGFINDYSHLKLKKKQNTIEYNINPNPPIKDSNFLQRGHSAGKLNSSNNLLQNTSVAVNNLYKQNSNQINIMNITNEPINPQNLINNQEKKLQRRFNSLLPDKEENISKENQNQKIKIYENINEIPPDPQIKPLNNLNNINKFQENKILYNQNPSNSLLNNNSVNINLISNNPLYNQIPCSLGTNYRFRYDNDNRSNNIVNIAEKNLNFFNQNNQKNLTKEKNNFPEKQNDIEKMLMDLKSIKKPKVEIKTTNLLKSPEKKIENDNIKKHDDINYLIIPDMGIAKGNIGITKGVIEDNTEGITQNNRRKSFGNLNTDMLRNFNLNDYKNLPNLELPIDYESSSERVKVNKYFINTLNSTVNDVRKNDLEISIKKLELILFYFTNIKNNK